MTFVGVDHEAATYAERVPTEPGTLDVLIHGTVDDFTVKTADGVLHIDHRSLATYIEKSGSKYKRIRLLACETGKHPKGAAQHLANKLGVAVIAPSDKLWIHEDGTLTIGPTASRNTGRWIVYEPTKSESRYQLATQSALTKPQDVAQSATQPTKAGAEPYILEHQNFVALGTESRPKAQKAADAAAQLAKIPIASTASTRAYSISPKDGESILTLLPLLDSTVGVVSYEDGFIVRHSGGEWYFRYDDKISKEPHPLKREEHGLPPANVATVELWGFRGMRKIGDRARELWTEQEVREVERIKEQDPLLYAGHVGVSFDGGKTIFGLTPKQPEGLTPKMFMDSLMSHEAYPAAVKDDTRVFREAASLAERGWNTEPIRAVELIDSPLNEQHSRRPNS